ncbi:MAG: 2-C-methyl-D-erythritol 4-phosphate cytidylyltransferase [Pseudomonadota bacterium]
MTTAALIVAAGRGQRMGKDQPKQYLPLGNLTVLAHTICAILTCDQVHTVHVVIHQSDQKLYEAATRPLADARLNPPILGGASRMESVRRGLEALSVAPPERVLIHDAARPFVDTGTITRVLTALKESDGAFPALPVVDAIWRVEHGAAAQPISRKDLWRAQTPQGFRFSAILKAHLASRGVNAADDVAVAKAAGLQVSVVTGSEANFKITTPEDLRRASEQLASTR